MKTAFLNMKKCVNNQICKENFANVCNNTGNNVFCNGLEKIFECDSIFPGELSNMADEYDNFITAAFIWIRENDDKSSFSRTLNLIKNKPVIPISVGLQCKEFNSDFKMHPATVKILADMAERATLAVRGEYTAEILNKYKIKNIQIIGCPSMYTELNPNKKIEKKPQSQINKIICNYRTISKDLTYKDYQVLQYLNSYSTLFIEQTVSYLPVEYYKFIPKEVTWLLTKKKRIYFKFEDWYNVVKRFDFSIGARFHGNMISLLAGVPSLFLTFDSRTKELTDFFKLPTLSIEDFDICKPIMYYYEKADYSEFNKNYNKLFNDFLKFAKKNKLTIRKKSDDSL